jgi:hypothetical protein
MSETKYQKVRKLIYDRKALISQLAELVQDDCNNISFFSHDKKYIVEQFESKQDKYNELLLELKCTHNNPIQNNAINLGEVKVNNN